MIKVIASREVELCLKRCWLEEISKVPSYTTCCRSLLLMTSIIDIFKNPTVTSLVHLIKSDIEKLFKYVCI